MKNSGLFKGLVILFVVISVISGVLFIHNKNTKKKAVGAAIVAVESVFSARAEYSEGTNRIIVEKYIKGEESLFYLTKEALPKLSIIGDYDVIELLSVRAYYGETKDNPQYYDIKFKDIKRLNWDEINNFDDFLTYLNVRLD